MDSSHRHHGPNLDRDPLRSVLDIIGSKFLHDYGIPGCRVELERTGPLSDGAGASTPSDDGFRRSTDHVPFPRSDVARRESLAERAWSGGGTTDVINANAIAALLAEKEEST